MTLDSAIRIPGDTAYDTEDDYYGRGGNTTADSRGGDTSRRLGTRAASSSARAARGRFPARRGPWRFASKRPPHAAILSM